MERYWKLTVTMLFICFSFALRENLVQAKEVKIGLSDISSILENQNLDLKALQMRIKAAGKNVYKAGSVFLPTVSLGLYYQRNHNNPIAPYADNNGYYLEIEQLIFSSPRLLDIEKAKLARHAMELTYDELFWQLLYRTKLLYLSAQVADAAVRVFSANKRLAQEYLDAIKVRYANGEASEYDLLRAEEELDLLDYEEKKMQVLRDNLISQLKILLGFSDKDVIDFREKVSFKDVHLDINGLRRIAQLYSPRLKKSTNALQIAGLEKQRAKMRFLPEVFLKYKDEADKLVAFSPNRAEYDHYSQIVISVKFPLFEGGRRVADVFKAGEEYRAKELEHSRLELELESELNCAYKEFLAYRSQVQATQLSLKRAQRLYQIMENRYKSGQASQLDVLDSRNTLMRAQMNYLSALKDYYSAIFQIEALVGKEVNYAL